MCILVMFTPVPKLDRTCVQCLLVPCYDSQVHCVPGIPGLSPFWVVGVFEVWQKLCYFGRIRRVFGSSPGHRDSHFWASLARFEPFSSRENQAKITFVPIGEENIKQVKTKSSSVQHGPHGF